jgi:hypothetical protein
MKKLFFSALIFCSLLPAAETNAQDFPITFDAVINSPIVTIRWRAAREDNTDRYVLEHAPDTVHFAPLHEVVALGGNGYDYSYEDEDSYPPAQTNYYRLRIINKDGYTWYSPIVAVDMADKKMPVLKPSVIHLGETLRLDTYFPQPVVVNFFNAGGIRVASYMVNSTAFDINTNGWGKGVYFYRISDARHPLIDAGKILVL